MRISEPAYDKFAEDQFPNRILIREWGNCRIWSAGIERPLLVLIDRGSRHVVVFEYDNVYERERDIQLVRHIKFGEGGAGKAVLAGNRTSPPARPAAAVEPIPCPERQTS